MVDEQRGVSRWWGERTSVGCGLGVGERKRPRAGDLRVHGSVGIPGRCERAALPSDTRTEDALPPRARLARGLLYVWHHPKANVLSSPRARVPFSCCLAPSMFRALKRHARPWWHATNAGGRCL
jgi:hypothetical protein